MSLPATNILKTIIKKRRDLTLRGTTLNNVLEIVVVCIVQIVSVIWIVYSFSKSKWSIRTVQNDFYMKIYLDIKLYIYIYIYLFR
jgi:hypothetical protein